MYVDSHIISLSILGPLTVVPPRRAVVGIASCVAGHIRSICNARAASRLRWMHAVVDNANAGVFECVFGLCGGTAEFTSQAN